MNLVIMTGRLAADPTEVSVPDRRLATFRLAVPRGTKRGDPTDFFPCEVWDKTAELVMTYCHKGQKILVQGLVVLDEYTDNGGEKRRYTKLRVSRIEFLEPKQIAQEQTPEPSRYAEEDPGDDEFPF